jgi:hypothetical protein
MRLAHIMTQPPITVRDDATAGDGRSGPHGNGGQGR